jgi:thioredoxin reductase (NADPH)
LTASECIDSAAYEDWITTSSEQSVEAQAAIVVICREPRARDILRRELCKRYGADYQIVVCDQPEQVAPWMRDLLAAGLPVAMVIGGVGGPDSDGIDVLAAIRRIDPTALRVAALAWGDWASTRSVFDAVTDGTVDHWVTRPEQAPAEEFHLSITEFLREWRSQRGERFEAVRVIGQQWSPRSQELRDLFARHRVPTGFYDVASVQGAAAPELKPDVCGLARGRTPVRSRAASLINYRTGEIADAFGLMTPISSERFRRYRIGAARRGSLRGGASSEGLDPGN